MNPDSSIARAGIVRLMLLSVLIHDSSAKAKADKVTQEKGSAARNGLEVRKAEVVVVAKKKKVVKMMFENQCKLEMKAWMI